MSRPMIVRLRPLAFLLLLLTALAVQATPWRSALAANDAGEMLDTCRMSGGGGSIENAGISCCWPGWGCLYCATDSQGAYIEGSCYMRCSSAECAEANAMTTHNPALPQTVKNPNAFFGETPNSVAPPKTKTPKIEPTPGVDTVK